MPVSGFPGLQVLPDPKDDGLSTFAKIFGQGAIGKFSAIGLGANLLATGFGFGAENRRRKRFEEALTKESQRFERIAEAGEFAPSATEGRLENVATRRALTGLASRGVLSSSIAPGVVAEGVAEVENQRQARVQRAKDQAAELRLAAANVAAGAPGGLDYAGELFGEAGSFLALRAGQEFAKSTNEDFAAKLERLFKKREEEKKQQFEDLLNTQDQVG